MATSLRIEVESTGVNAPPVENTSAPKTFNQMKEEREAAANKFREDAARMRKETGMGGTVTPAQERKRIADEERQNRDENWLARQEARAQRRADALEEREEKRREAQERKAEARQERDENWLARREAMDARKNQAELEKAAAARQRDDERKQAEAVAEQKKRDDRDPKVLARRMIEGQKLREETRKEYEKQTGQGMLHDLGSSVIQLAGQRVVSRASGVSAIAAPVRHVVARLTSFAGSLPPVVKGLGLVGASAGAAAFAWSKAVNVMMHEAERVQQFSPALAMQNVTNQIRNMQTDMEIAQKYGGNMARLSDRENRQENAMRKISAAVSDFVTSGYGYNLIADTWTDVLEWMAGTSKATEKSAKELAKIAGLSKEMYDTIDKMPKDSETIALALASAKHTINVLSNGNFNGFGNNEGFVKEAFGKINPDMRFPNKSVNLTPVLAHWRNWNG